MYLQRYATMAELVAAYFDENASIEQDARPPATCHIAGGRTFKIGVVTNSALRRRAQRLIAAHITGS